MNLRTSIPACRLHKNGEGMPCVLSCLLIVRLLLLTALLFIPVQSQILDSISLNSVLLGTTIGAKRRIFTTFSLFDNRDAKVGVGGQKIVELVIPGEQEDQPDQEKPDILEVDIQLSTCVGSDFDTYLALLDSNPINTTGALIVAEGANDVSCIGDRTRAYLTTKVLPGTYYVLVTGNGAREGKFNLSATGAKVTPAAVPWGLDRIDQRSLPLNKEYSVQDSGENVWIYVVDSGVRISHEEFEGRAHAGYDFVNNINSFAADCTGHGTHVAGIMAGKTFGVSRKAQIVAVKVFGCDNRAKVTSIVNALEWILVDSKIRAREHVVVALMFNVRSSGQASMESTMSGIERSGLPVIVPAGNQDAKTCDYYPSSMETVLAVGSTDLNDDRSQFSNSGQCNDLYAPGAAIPSSWHTSDTAWRNVGGTSQASAHIAGIVANLMTINSGIKSKKIRNVMSSISTLDIVGNVEKNDSTRFAFVRSVPPFRGDPPQQRYVFLFSILSVETSSCEASSNEIVTIHEMFTDVLSIRSSDLGVTCSDGRSASSKTIQLRVLIEERKAALTFVKFEEAVTSEKAKLTEALGLRFDVVELPWAVDSTPTVIWGAPSFSETESHSLSAGAIAGIAAAAFCVIAIALIAIWLSYRRITKADEVQSMEGSADMERGPVHFDDFGKADDPSSPKSFRNIVRGLSFRRSTSMPNGVIGEEARGINRTSSFIGGPDARVASDMVRVESFGGEALAGLARLSSNCSTSSVVEREEKDQDSSESDPTHSFRGPSNAVLNFTPAEIGSSPSEPEGSMIDESIRMQSLGGEAFAIISENLRSPSITATRNPAMASFLSRQERPEEVNRIPADYEGDEGLVSQKENDHDLSFFGGRGNKKEREEG